MGKGVPPGRRPNDLPVELPNARPRPFPSYFPIIFSAFCAYIYIYIYIYHTYISYIYITHIYHTYISYIYIIHIYRIFATEKSDRNFPENLRSNRCFLKISRPRNFYGLSLRLIVLIRRRASAGVYNVAVARHFLFHRPKTKIVNLSHITKYRQISSTTVFLHEID